MASDPMVLPESDPLESLVAFRREFYACLQRRGDALFELCEALLTEPGRVQALPYLSLSDRFGRGHDMIYQALNAGKIDVERLRALAACQRIPRVGGRIVLGVDGTPWLRPDANTSPDRGFCHVGGRGGADQMIPGWSYSIVAALGSGASSWTTMLDVDRVDPDSTETETAAVQVRRVVEALIAAGQWREGDPAVMVVTDSGYTPTYLAWQWSDLPVQIVCRVRSNRVYYGPPSERGLFAGRGRPARHGQKVCLAQEATWPEPAVATGQVTARYGRLDVRAFDRLHQQLSRQQRGWVDHCGPLPVIEGTVVRLEPERLPHNGNPEPVWLWTAAVGLDVDAVTSAYTAWLRRFDLEHTNRFLKQYLALTQPRLRESAAADRWVQLVWAAHLQLCLARPLVADHRLPWERRLAPAALTPLRVKRGFRYLGGDLPRVSSVPKTRTGGTGRPAGRRNDHHAPVQPVGKSPKRTGDGTERIRAANPP